MPDPMEDYGPVVGRGKFEAEDFATIYLALKKLYESGIDQEEGLEDIHKRAGRLGHAFYLLLHKIQQEILREYREKENLR